MADLTTCYDPQVAELAALLDDLATKQAYLEHDAPKANAATAALAELRARLERSPKWQKWAAVVNEYKDRETVIKDGAVRARKMAIELAQAGKEIPLGVQMSHTESAEIPSEMAFVQWCVEHNHLELLQPKALNAKAGKLLQDMGAPVKVTRSFAPRILWKKLMEIVTPF